MFSLTVRGHMMIAHSLSGQVFGPAQRLHGATYVVDVEFRRPELDVDGIVIEHRPTTDVLAVKFAGRTYGNAGAGFEHRRVIVISRTLSDAQAWAGITGVTHVALHPDGYDHAEPPVVTPTPLTDRPHRRP